MTVGDWPIYPSGDPPGMPGGEWREDVEALLFLMEVAHVAGVTMDDANQALASAGDGAAARIVTEFRALNARAVQAAYGVSPDQVGLV
jgi:hypothetical protein